jgi:CheY-like chemotaxis protein
MNRSRILIVEDELIVAEDLKMTLDTLGYDVVGISATGEEAIALAVEKRPDIILMDIMLAGEMDGITTAGKIRAQFDIPIIYVTAYADETLVSRAKLTEPFGYIVKPFNEREVHSNIEISLYRHRMEKELKKRDAILLGIGAGIEWFLREFLASHIITPNPDRKEKKSPGYTPLLENIGNAMNLDRIVIFQNDNDGNTVTLTGEWTAGIAAPLPRSSQTSNIPISRFGLGDREPNLRQGQAVPVHADDAEPSVREFFRSYRLGSIAMLQLQTADRPYGIILYVSSGERKWFQEELEAMRIAANIIGTAIGMSKDDH